MNEGNDFTSQNKNRERSIIMDKLLTRAFDGDPRSIGRLISLVEAESPESKEIMKTVYPRTGRAHVIGITGSPGAGKSTFVNRLISQFKADGKKVGVIAIDPSSPFTGGAILGDRLRMQDHAVEEGVSSAALVRAEISAASAAARTKRRSYSTPADSTQS